MSRNPNPLQPCRAKLPFLTSQQTNRKHKLKLSFGQRHLGEFVSNLICDMRPAVLYIGAGKSYVPPSCVGSLKKDQEQINKGWKVIIVEKRSTECVFVFFSVESEDSA